MKVIAYLSQAGVAALAAGSPYFYYHVHCLVDDGSQKLPAGAVALGDLQAAFPSQSEAQEIRARELQAIIEQENAQHTLRLQPLLEELGKVDKEGGAA